MERRRRDLKGLDSTISQYETSLGGAQVQSEGTLAHDDDPSDSEVEGAMATTPVANDAPAVSTTPESDFPSRGGTDTFHGGGSRG